jgi:hypothetical protein
MKNYTHTHRIKNPNSEPELSLNNCEAIVQAAIV